MIDVPISNIGDVFGENTSVISISLSNDKHPHLACRVLMCVDYSWSDEGFAERLRASLGVRDRYDEKFTINEADLVPWLESFDEMDLADIPEDLRKSHLLHLLRLDGNEDFVVLDFSGVPIEWKSITMDDIREILQRAYDKYHENANTDNGCNPIKALLVYKVDYI